MPLRRNSRRRLRERPLARGLMRLDNEGHFPRLFFTEAGLTALRAMMTDRRLVEPPGLVKSASDDWTTDAVCWQGQSDTLPQFYRRLDHLPGWRGAALRAPDPAFPLLRRAGAINDEVDVPLGLMGSFTPIVKTGKGFYQGIGVGWFEPEGRAHGKILLTDGRRIQYVAIFHPA